MKPAKQCVDAQKNVCKMVPQPDICKEVPIKPFEVCQPTKSCAEASEIEICTVPGITEIFQECTEKCVKAKADVCTNKQVEVS